MRVGPGAALLAAAAVAGCRGQAAAWGQAGRRMGWAKYNLRLNSDDCIKRIKTTLTVMEC